MEDDQHGEEQVQQTTPAEEMPQPVCPWCGTDPCAFTLAPLHFGPMEAAVLYCSNDACRKVLGISMLGVVPQPMAVPDGRLPAHLPHLGRNR